MRNVRNAAVAAAGQAAVLLLLFATSALATTPTTALTGRVMTGGAPAGGVTVTAASPALQHERSTVTTPDGRYWLTALPPGKYEVTFARAGLQTLTKRAVVEIARVARADAALEPSEDEESVTSTALTVGVADTTTLTTHVSDETLDRLPVERSPGGAASVAPGTFLGPTVLVDDAPAFVGGGAEDALEQVTILRGGLTSEYGGFFSVAAARTRSGGEDFFLSLRDTVTDSSWLNDRPVLLDRGTQHLLEASAGGRILPEKLWFFTSAWSGGRAFRPDGSGLEAKLTAQLGASHNLMALYNDLREDDSFRASPAVQTATLRYTGALGPRFTAEAYASRTSFNVSGPAPPPSPSPSPSPRFVIDRDAIFARTTWVAPASFGDHILTAGGQTVHNQLFSEGGSAFFVNDRWLAGRWTVNAGVRHELDRFLPRLGASYDLLGDGRHAVIATFGDYELRTGSFRELTLGWASAIGNTGSVRADAIRLDYGPGSVNGGQASFNYSLFDRFHTGASYTFQNPAGITGGAKHVANAWAGVDLPVGSHEFGVTVLERFQSAVAYFDTGSAHFTDLALRYSIPMSHVGLTIAGDVTNVFDEQVRFYAAGRAVRAWARLRV